MGSSSSAAPILVMPPPDLPAPPAEETVDELLARSLRPGSTELDFRGRRIGAGGAAVLAKFLSSETGISVNVLHLSGNGLGDDGAACLADALAAGTGLHYLDLRSNGIGDAGAERLAAALAAGSSLASRNSLETLDLWFNRIGTKGFQQLSDALEINQSIVWLRLDEEVPRVTQALTRNITASRRFVVLSVHALPSGDLLFMTLGGTELQRFIPSPHELEWVGGFEPRRQALAAVAGVKPAFLRLMLPDGRLLDPAGDLHALLDLVVAAAANPA